MRPAIALFLFIFFGFSLLSGWGGHDIEYIDNHIMEVRSLEFDKPLIYVSGYKDGIFDKEATRINRTLNYLGYRDIVGLYGFKNSFRIVEYIHSNTKFRVVGKYWVRPRWFRKVYSSPYQKTVIEDESGRKSIYSRGLMDHQNSETSNNFHKRVALLDFLSVSDSRCTVSFFTETQKSYIEKYADYYKATIINGTANSGFYVVEGGANFLAFLYTSEEDLRIFNIDETQCKMS